MNSMINTAYTIQSPLFERTGSEGHQVPVYVILVIAEDMLGNSFTHQQDFEPYELDRAETFAERVMDRGDINTEFWHEGNPWDRYLVPQTYEEEKAEALWNEAFA